MSSDGNKDGFVRPVGISVNTWDKEREGSWSEAQKVWGASRKESETEAACTGNRC